MKLKPILLATALTGVTFFTSSISVQAQVCLRKPVVPAANSTKFFNQNQFKYRFKIPTNYKVLAIRENGLLVLDPKSYARSKCFIRNKVTTEYTYGIYVSAQPIKPSNQNLAAIVKQNNPLVENIQATKIDNKSAVSYTSSTLGYEKSVSFFTPDKKYLITISAPFEIKQGVPTVIFNKDVFESVLATFSFRQS